MSGPDGLARRSLAGVLAIMYRHCCVAQLEDSCVVGPNLYARTIDPFHARAYPCTSYGSAGLEHSTRRFRLLPEVSWNDRI